MNPFCLTIVRGRYQAPRANALINGCSCQQNALVDLERGGGQIWIIL
uniref:Uncharacterized protein n=1 Tax=Arundo donax TaxID=35708 RepID=A0A0A8XRE5_ARUDO